MILLVLIALVARVDAAPGAAPGDDSIALAIRYANLLTGADDSGDGDQVAQADAGPDDARDVGEADAADEPRDAQQATGLEVAGDAGTAGLEASALEALQPDGPDGQLALLEAEQTSAGAIAENAAENDAIVAASPAGAIEAYESWMRHPRLSPWGRLDLRLAWRRHWSEPMRAQPLRTDEVWLVATWRR